MNKRNAKYKKDKKDESRLQYKKLRNICNKKVRNAKRLFFTTGLRSNCKQYWKNLQYCYGYGKRKLSAFPLPSSTLNTALQSAITINKHYIDSINNITTTFD